MWIKTFSLDVCIFLSLSVIPIRADDKKHEFGTAKKLYNTMFSN